MKRRKKKTEKNTLSLALLFVVLVGFLVVLSFSIRLITIARKSVFDGKHRFTIALVGSGGESGKKESMLLSVAPSTETVTVLRVSGLSAKEDESFFKIPVDGIVESPSVDSSALNEKSQVDMLFARLLVGFGERTTTLTPVDILRALVYVKSVPAQNTTFETFEKSATADQGLQDKFVFRLFADADIIREKQSIAIVNAAGVVGLGSALSRMITNIGGNVVSLSNASANQKKTSVRYYGTKSYTAERIARIVEVVPEPLEKIDIADIMIVLGENNRVLGKL